MPPLPPILSPSYLSSLRSHPHLPQHTWYFLAGVTLSTLNRPNELGAVLKYALDKGVHASDDGPIQEKAEQLRVARRMREALVKSSAIIGLPKTINALTSLASATPPALLDPPCPRPSPTRRILDLHSTPVSKILNRGDRLWNRIYGKIASRVTHQLGAVGTEDLLTAAQLEYGYILSGGNGILSELETSWTVLACLVPQDVNPQLKGHLRGAMNLGGTREEVSAVREVIVGLCERAGMKVNEVGGWREDVAKL